MAHSDWHTWIKKNMGEIKLALTPKPSCAVSTQNAQNWNPKTSRSLRRLILWFFLDKTLNQSSFGINNGTKESLTFAEDQCYLTIPLPFWHWVLCVKLIQRIKVSNLHAVHLCATHNTSTKDILAGQKQIIYI